MKKKLIIFGTSQFAEVAHFYFSRDSNYQVAGFTVDGNYLKESEFSGAPIVAFEELTQHFPPAEHDLFVAIAYKRMNQARAEKYYAAKQLGYRLASYISSKTSALEPPAVGDNCFILEDNTIQPFTTLGNNTIIWSGNHLGHHARVGNHCFISSHVCIAGGAVIEDYCFLGINSNISNGVTVAQRCLIGAGALILQSTAAREVYAPRGDTPRKVDVDSIEF